MVYHIYLIKIIHKINQQDTLVSPKHHNTRNKHTLKKWRELTFNLLSGNKVKFKDGEEIHKVLEREVVPRALHTRFANNSKMEEERFELSNGFPSAVFKTAAFNRSATPPQCLKL